MALLIFGIVGLVVLTVVTCKLHITDCWHKQKTVQRMWQVIHTSDNKKGLGGFMSRSWMRKVTHQNLKQQATTVHLLASRYMPIPPQKIFNHVRDLFLYHILPLLEKMGNISSQNASHTLRFVLFQMGNSYCQQYYWIN